MRMLLYIFTLLALILTGSESCLAGEVNIFKIAQSGTAQEVKEAIKNGATANATIADGATPLHIAALANPHPDVIAALIAAGATANATSAKGATPLHFAALANPHPDVIAALIAAGAKVDAVTIDGLSPLLMAMGKANIPAINELIKHGANVNIKFHEGNTPLHMAVEMSNLEITNILITAKAEINAANKDGYTPLLTAARGCKDPKIITTLLKAGADTKARIKAGGNVLVMAAVNPNPEIIATLIKSGIAIPAKGDNAKEERANVLIAAAMANPNADMCKFLLKQGIDVNDQMNNGMTALHAAATKNSPEVVETLLKAGGKIDGLYEVVDDYAVTPLIASVANSPQVVKLLLNAGANVNAIGFDKKLGRITALDVAVNENKEEIAKLLISAGGKRAKELIQK